jgi:hypothetical protein
VVITLKKVSIIIGVAFVFLLLSIFIYLKLNPPLSTPGYSSYSDDKMKRIVEIVNSGFANIKIKSVLINGNKAQKVDLGASKTEHLVAGAGIEEDPNITFHNINDLEVQPVVERDKLSLKGKDLIKHYGLRVYGNEVPKKVMIKYNYLGIPFSLEVSVKE